MGAKLPHKPVSEGLKTAGEVNYLAIAGKSSGCTPEMSGSMAVVRHILGTEYLWNNVRVLGGAYGSGFNYDISRGIGSFTSYRDPHLERTLDVYKKAADYLAVRYKRALSAGKAMTAVCPSHYMGLAELYRVTREEKYLEALKDAIALRDLVEDGTDDNQDAQQLRTQRVMHGHAVRATYLYAGVADLYLETGDNELLTVLDSCFDNLVSTKMYITGGLGALYTGASPFGDLINSKRVHQAFGYEYQLPNITAYNETCVSLGGVFWAQRMFALRPDSAYIDFIERIAYNLAFAAMNTAGDKYFYENMLRRTREVDYFLMWPRERTDTFKCFCCPTNLSRFIAELPQYAFFTSDDTLYACKTQITLKNGASFDIE